MNKDTIIKILLGIIALLVFAWVWRIISGMLIGKKSHPQEQIMLPMGGILYRLMDCAILW